jgi:hypothetical protein
MDAYDDQIDLRRNDKKKAFHAFLKEKRGNLSDAGFIKKIAELNSCNEEDAKNLFKNLKRYFNEKHTELPTTVQGKTWKRFCEVLGTSTQDWEEYWRDWQHGNASSQQAEDNSLAENFLEGIKQHIIDELDAPGVKLLKYQVNSALEDCLKKLKRPALKSDYTETLAEAWINLLRNHEQTCPAINNVLMNVTGNCLDKEKKGSIFEKISGNHKAYKEALLQILGWLSLAAIKDDAFLEFLNNSPDLSVVHFEIPVETLGGVELILSRHNNRSPKFSIEGNRFSAGHMIQGAELLLKLSWSVEEIAVNLELLVWNSVPSLDNKSEGTSLSESELRDLNIEIGTLNEYDDPYKKQFTLVIPQTQLSADLKENDGFLKEIYQKIHADLSNLMLVQFTMQNNSSFFYIPEPQLMNAIKNYLIFINKLCLP